MGGGGQLLGLVAGVGVNVNNPVPIGAITLAQILGSPLHRSLDRTEIAGWVLQGMEQGFHVWLQGGFAPVRSEYEAWMVKPQVQWLERGTSLTILGLAEDGRVRVQTQGERHLQQQQSIRTLTPDQVRLSYHMPAGDSL